MAHNLQGLQGSLARDDGGSYLLRLSDRTDAVIERWRFHGFDSPTGGKSKAAVRRMLACTNALSEAPDDVVARVGGHHGSVEERLAVAVLAGDAAAARALADLVVRDAAAGTPAPCRPGRHLVVVEISGGVFNEVYTDLPEACLDVVLVDWDNLNSGENEAGRVPVRGLDEMTDETACHVEAAQEEPQ